jgi:hypothetical protein
MKLKLGPMIGQASGALGATVFSHNRGGPYARLRAIPGNPQTTYQLGVRARMQTASSQWRGLTEAQRDAWTAWASANPIVDRLGDSRILSGIAAYNSLSTHLLQLGLASVATPPVVAAPVSLLTLTLTADIGAGNFEIIYTTTPAPAAHSIWIRACKLPSASINYVKNRLRVTQISAAAAASPLDVQAGIETQFGASLVGEKVVVFVTVINRANGLMSLPQRAEAIVVST